MKPKVLKLRLAGRSKYLRLLSGFPQTLNLRAGLVNLKKGQSVGEHSTDLKEEVLAILKGRARISYAHKASFKAGPGAFIYIPPNTCHDVKNCGKTPLRYVYITSALGHLFQK